MRESEIKALLDYIVQSGKEIVPKSGSIKDIGVKKQFLSEEDIKIERGIKNIIEGFAGVNSFYAEEENDKFIEGESVWIADAISGTKLFIEGKLHYAVVVSHLHNGKVDFAAVYDPTVDKLYTADDNAGTYLNNVRLNAKNAPYRKRIIYAPSYGWKDSEQIERIREILNSKYDVHPSQGSFAVNYCLVAEGEFDGVVSLTKDSFPEFAGCFIANKAGARATNISNETEIKPENRAFVCGNSETLHQELLDEVRKEFSIY